MKEICSKNLCTGCSLCAIKCTKKSITMRKIDDLGHLYPVIDPKTCINCHLCQKVCPQLNPSPKTYPYKCYAAWSKDEIDYRSSTSGGVASVLSQYFVNNGGVVYGCAMQPNVIVKHIRVDKINELTKLKGSKYVQSDISEVLPQLKKDIKDGKLTLFIGTPCQCAAVRNLFSEQPINLYIVDLICHGIPSIDFLQKHIKKIIGNIHADTIKFRDEMGHYVMEVTVNGKIRYKKALKGPRYEDLYFNTFIDGYTFRSSCYKCYYASPERAFDITIGDFWGLGKESSTTEIPKHPYGCSVIIPSTNKGINLVEIIKDKINLYPREVIEAVNGNNQLRSPFKLNWRIKTFRWCVCKGISPEIYRLLILDKKIKLRLRKFIKGSKCPKLTYCIKNQ